MSNASGLYTLSGWSALSGVRGDLGSERPAGEAIGEEAQPFLGGEVQLVEIARQMPADAGAKHAAAKIRGPGGEIVPARGFETRQRAGHVEGRGHEDPGRAAALQAYAVAAFEERPGEARILCGVARAVLDQDPPRGDAARREEGLGQGSGGGTRADEARAAASEDEGRLGEAMGECDACEEALARLVQRNLARGGPAVGFLAPAEHDDPYAASPSH